LQALLYSGKEYICVMKLHGDVQASRIHKILGEFEDEIYQRPPLRSSVKRQIRTRKIYYNEFIEMQGRNVLFLVGCEGGTYIRKLCYDIGEIAGVGAHMQELRRTRSGPLSETSRALSRYTCAYCLTMEKTIPPNITHLEFIQHANPRNGSKIPGKGTAVMSLHTAPTSRSEGFLSDRGQYQKTP
jgi:H/ACA ribonucleoprotein complex subunit 4